MLSSTSTCRKEGTVIIFLYSLPLLVALANTLSVINRVKANVGNGDDLVDFSRKKHSSQVEMNQ